MPTFSKKVEVVDARQFTGGPKNGREMVRWITANGGRAKWFGTQQVHAIDGTKVEMVTTQDVLTFDVKDPKNVRPNAVDEVMISPGCWVLCKDEGVFDWKTDEALQAEYDIQ